MTQQKIYFGISSKKIKESFISHIKKAIFANELSINDKLENLHESFPNHKKLLKKGTDQSTIFHKAIYSTFDDKNFFLTDFWKSYSELSLEIVEILKNETGYFGEWAIQRYPTIRFQFPENVSVFEFHRDSNYSHPIGEINCFYAINKCINSSALQVEKNLGFEDYVPLNLNPGQYALLNTSIYKHGDFLNVTNKTRISMDLRFIPNSKLTNENISLTKGIGFNSNSYFIKENDMRKINN
tara:strand:+ start:109 stop:828 length:720 start_codon:yes stop_codon:yes gene_type:complete